MQISLDLLDLAEALRHWKKSSHDHRTRGGRIDSNKKRRGLRDPASPDDVNLVLVTVPLMVPFR